MQPVIYAGLRNPGRDQSIYNAILSRPVSEVAEELKCSPSTVRAAAKRIADLQTFQLTLTGGGEGHSYRHCRGEVVQARRPRRLQAFQRDVQESGTAALGDQRWREPDLHR